MAEPGQTPATVQWTGNWRERDGGYDGQQRGACHNVFCCSSRCCAVLCLAKIDSGTRHLMIEEADKIHVLLALPTTSFPSTCAPPSSNFVQVEPVFSLRPPEVQHQAMLGVPIVEISEADRQEELCSVEKN